MRTLTLCINGQNNLIETVGIKGSFKPFRTRNLKIEDFRRKPVLGSFINVQLLPRSFRIIKKMIILKKLMKSESLTKLFFCKFSSEILNLSFFKLQPNLKFVSEEEEELLCCNCLCSSKNCSKCLSLAAHYCRCVWLSLNVKNKKFSIQFCPLIFFCLFPVHFSFNFFIVKFHQLHSCDLGTN